MHAMESPTLGRRLINAAGDGKVQLMEQLIEAGVPVDYTTGRGPTPLRAAVWSNHQECVRLLIEKKADVNRRGHDVCGDIGGTVLMNAAGWCHHTCMSLLLNAGARVNIVDNYGQTALLSAVSSGCRTCIDMLIDAGARVDVVDHQGKSLLRHAPKGRDFTFVEAMLRVPNKEQKKKICLFLGCAKKYGAKYGFNKSFLASLKPFIVIAVCDQNKREFKKSVAYQEILKLPEGEKKEALLEKYGCSECLNSEDTNFLNYQHECSIQ